MKVKITPIITPDNRGIVNVPVSDFTVIENSQDQNIALSDSNMPLRHILSDMSSGSITPTTFESREFVENTSDQWFIDNYEYHENKVIRFGINTYTLALDDINLEGSEDMESKTEIVSQNIRSASSSSTNYKAIAESIMHTPVEKIVFEKAVNYLLDNEDKKTVLVDIFVRDQHTIQMKEDYPESHTLVLYKNPVLNGKHEILVIDPSNFIFSSHLSNSDIRPANTLLDKITVLHKKDIQIYIPQGEVGPLANQYRDCIDLSVKIALHLNRTDDSNLNLQDVKNWEMIRELTNNKKIDKNVVDAEASVRIKQTSDIEIVHKFNIVTNSINKIFDIASIVSMDIRSEFKNSYCALLCNLKDELDLLPLVDYRKTCVNQLFNTLEIENDNLLKLIGEGWDI